MNDLVPVCKASIPFCCELCLWADEEELNDAMEDEDD